MRLVRLLAALSLFGVAACGTTTEPMRQGGAPQIDEPSGPFPYNSRFCT